MPSGSIPRPTPRRLLLWLNDQLFLDRQEDNHMSGSGGGGGGGFDSPPDNCAALVFDTQLSSPKQAVVTAIQVGDELLVATQTVADTTVVVVLHNGQVAGGLASPLVQRLRECMAGGTQYVATVTAKNDGQVRVRVKAA